VNNTRTDVEHAARQWTEGPDDEHLTFPQVATKAIDGDVEEYAYSVLLEILAAAKTVHQKLVTTKGISFDEFRILMRLERAEKDGSFVIQEHLVQELGLSPSRISSILNALDASDSFPGGRQAGKINSRAWIKRKEDPARRRQKLVSLTDEGKRMLDAARPDYMRQIQKAVKAVGLKNLLQLRFSLFCINLALDPRHTPIDIGARAGAMQKLTSLENTGGEDQRNGFFHQG